MIDKVILAIVNKLFEYNSEAEIYIDKLEQGFKEPCFFIKTLPFQETPIVGERYKRRYDFCIHCFSDEKDRLKLFKEGEAISEQLEYLINSDIVLTGIDRRVEVNDDVVMCFVSYIIHILKKDEDVARFESIATNIKT